ncbi:hypothetical protein CONPUDRAFT_79733 [Coniophora puteana RWD-64-598 SS2]|uniref:FUN14-domain-containing protein n=1 Tax=Coniophora puteana (strain RWD-64-598) TaxID=741705 RepID=A0A5M3N1Z5_CONPW|nr:uncharacterized protein CONPUDRAFT_79733 [Coniophora puteana RWD-64-598 SS2]EIW85034.1 hypothetical protein CONPUDRAFT_79733 [Coniophora puteana RWD-64-598 SS2]
MALRQSTISSTSLAYRNIACLNLRSSHRWAPLVSQTSQLTTRKNNVALWSTVGIVCFGLGVNELASPTLRCDAPPRPPLPLSSEINAPPAPSSMVNMRELTFGTVCGVCAGVFIKKGARLVAFCLGGVFVLLQFLGSASIVRIDWRQAGARFENLFYRTDSLGHKRAPTIGSIWNGLVNFLTADFQPRASFVAGLALGIRIG